MDPELLFSIIAIFICLLCSAFFSGSETALTAVSRARIYHLIMENNKRARLVARLKEQKESLIGSILLGNNIVNILAASLATSIAIKLFGNAGVAYATAAMTVIVVIFSEVMPKTYAIHRAEKVSLLAAPIILVLIKITYPFVTLVKALIAAIFRLFGVRLEDDHAFVSAADVLRGTIEMQHRSGSMEKQDRDMLGGVLELDDTTVEDVMVHRKHIDAINIEDDIKTILSHATASSHSRLPVYREDFSQIIGLLHVKNLLRLIHQTGQQNVTHKDILRIASKPWFIPSTTSLKDQLYTFKQRRQHFAMVVDEYGSLLGIVTLEDVIEEIVGEIDDEYDTIDLTNILQLSDTSWLVDGDVGIRDLNRYLDWNLPDEEATTIAGLVLHEAGDIPETGRSFTIGDAQITVEARTDTQLTRLKIERLATSEDSISEGL
jgi:Mg2+/Co2+ transporter CorB